MAHTDEVALIERATRFAHERVLPDAARWEIERRQPRERLAEAAFLSGLLVPASLGGAGVSLTAFARIAAALASADLGFAFALVVHNNLMKAIATHGGPAQQRLLPSMQTLKTLGAFLLTEDNGGSDPAKLQTHAERTASGWRLNGSKAWVTNAANADILSVYAQTQPGSGASGIAAFLVAADQAGVTRSAPYELIGCHSMGTGGFTFSDCEVDDDALLVPPGGGFKAALSGIDLARAVVAAMSGGMLNASLQYAVDAARQRELFGKPLAEQQGMQWQLADVATDAHAIELLAYHATALLDAGTPATIAAAHAKKFATRALLAGVAQCLQSLGANGLRQDTPIARHYAAAKVAQYIDGTTEIQNVVIARGLLRDADTA
ncbi:MAG: acyl-CoA dehydrogenase family protein [Pseudomonadota bacterium]